MPYGHSKIWDGIIQGKHLSHYTCKCSNYQEYYFNRFFTDSFSCLSHSDWDAGKGRHQGGGGDPAASVFYCSWYPTSPLQLGALQEMQEKQGSHPAAAGRQLCCEIKHLRSLLGWPEPKHKGPECFSSSLVKTPPDFWLSGAVGSSQQQRLARTASLPSQLFPVLQSSFWTCSCSDLADAAFSTNTIQAPLAAEENYTLAMVKTVGSCVVQSFYWKAARAWRAGFSISKDSCRNITFQACSFSFAGNIIC